jgi:hypothetical protein
MPIPGTTWGKHSKLTKVYQRRHRQGSARWSARPKIGIGPRATGISPPAPRFKAIHRPPGKSLVKRDPPKNCRIHKLARFLSTSGPPRNFHSIEGEILDRAAHKALPRASKNKRPHLGEKAQFSPLPARHPHPPPNPQTKTSGKQQQQHYKNKTTTARTGQVEHGRDPNFSSAYQDSVQLFSAACPLRKLGLQLNFIRFRISKAKNEVANIPIALAGRSP